MPELPEVETIRRVLQPQLTGQRITAVEILNPQVVAYPTPGAFIEALTGRIITGMGRRGKFLSFLLEDGSELVLHLRMTGQPLILPKNEPFEKHTHIILHLENGSQFRYIDVRRFGRFWLLRKDEPDTVTGRDKLGLEPDDPRLTAVWLEEQLATRKKPIKEMLNDQSIVAGIGNIYSDEILFAAGIHPETKCNMLTDTDWAALAKAIPEIIAWGIETDAMTPEEYAVTRGKEYRNTPDLKAYGRAGKPCPRCGTTMEKLTVAGRSSCFCPVCQKEHSC